MSVHSPFFQDSLNRGPVLKRHVLTIIDNFPFIQVAHNYWQALN